MNSHWHEQIQRFLDGTLGTQESAALIRALSEDPELRLLYLDYVNLDAALTSLARRPNLSGPDTASTPGGPRAASLSWFAGNRIWLVPAAACLALLFAGVFSESRTHRPRKPGIGEVTAAARRSISHLRPAMPTPIPAWMSPTATLLNEPDYARR